MPRNPSREVFSSQTEVHPRLAGLLDKHESCAWSQPYHQPSVQAFRELEALLRGHNRPLVLDSGCGTGESTRLLARMFPECTVIGVDKSSARLDRTGADSFPHQQENAIWLRADLSTFWRLAVSSCWRLQRHYILYPNPWPKPGALQRRWHGHPVFPDLLSLGGRLELRTNWEIYALEFASAVNRLLGVHVQPGTPAVSPALSPFERKYRDSGHPLYSVVVSCDSRGVK
jgi:tRNA (guanine-N7-)-methyltransferase